MPQAGSGFYRDNQPSAVGVSRWDGNAFAPLGTLLGCDAAIRDFATTASGDTFAVGDFRVIGGLGANRLARWDGTSWSSIGAWFNGDVRRVAALPNGGIVVAGNFTIATGVSANRIAQWNGQNWSALGGGSQGSVLDLAVLTDGSIVANGTFSLSSGVAAFARWNGTAWLAMPGGPSTAHSFHAAPDGSLLVGGRSILGAYGVSRWHGGIWTQLGNNMNQRIDALETLPDGSVVAVGRFTQTGSTTTMYAAQWHGSAWQSMGPGLNSAAEALEVLPGGDLVATGYFLAAGAVTANRIARWDGAYWSALGAGLDSRAMALEWRPDGLLVGGELITANGALSAFVATYASTCPATITPVGAACAGSGGATDYQPTALPWLGSTLRARGTGLPAIALVLVVSGLSELPSPVPLNNLLSPANALCELRVPSDSLEMMLAIAGSVETSLAIPNAISLVGVEVFQQLVAIEFDNALQVVEFTSSNALHATVGAF